MKNLKYILFSIIILSVLIFVYFLTYTFVEPKAYDFMTKYVLTEKLPFDNKKNLYGHDDIVLVVIDKKTNERYRWPWKRQTYCKLFEYFYNYAEPKVVVHDSIITTLDNDNPESDKKLFRTLNKFNNLVEGFAPQIAGWENEQEGEKYEKIFADKFSLKIENTSNAPDTLYSSVLKFPKPYFDVLKYIGSVSILPGFLDGNLSDYAIDEIYRNAEYLINYKGNFYPSLGMQAFLNANNNPKIVLNNKFIEFPELDYKIKHHITDYQVITPIKYYKMYSDTGYSHIKVSAVDVMDSYDAILSGKKAIVPPEYFKNKIIVIGGNVPAAAGLNDNKNSPVSVNHPGVDIQATMIDNLVHKDFLKVLPKWINILITILGMLFVYYTIRVHALIKSISYSILILLTYLGAVSACFYYGTIINVITPPVMFTVTMILAYVHKYVIEARNKEKVKKAMGKYMSEDVMERIVQNIDNLGLGGKKAIVTVLFSDIRGFTSMSENMSAQQVSELLNEYFSEMEPIVTKYNGIINKFIGDAVMAIFGEPIQDENHASNAVKCGYEMLERVNELHKKWKEEEKPLIEIGIGINTGEVFVGNIGSVNRMEYTVIGDTVNLASRLESYNKQYQTKMLISETTYDAVKDFVEVNLISDVEIRGKSHKMNIYEVRATKQPNG